MSAISGITPPRSTWANGIGQALDMAMACPGQSYTVVAGDTLALIAQRFLGSGALWVELTNPDGTPFTEAEAENLQIGQVVCTPVQSTGSQPLDFLRGISGSQTVAGQHNREPNSEPALWTNWIYDTTGKFPGLWSGDFLYEQDDIDDRGTMIDEAKSQWQQGALINLMYHAAPPDLGEPCAWDPGVINHPLSDDQWNDLITDGGYLNTQWKARLDVISVFLQDLKDSGVQVLWRPFHEMNQGEFWWGGRPGPQGTLRLYQITHDYMVGTKGLTNLTWVWDVQDLDFTWADYNPGDGYWDVFAMDMYGDGYTTEKYTTMLQIAGDSPIAIGECEVLPTADELAAQPRWTFFMAWAELVQAGNSVEQIQDLYNAANVITLGQMPGWGAQMANLYVFHQGEENDGQLWYSSNDNVNWTTDTQVQNVSMSESPSAVPWAGGITVFHQGPGDGQLWYTYSSDGTNWGGDTLVQNLGISESPSAVVYNGNLYVFHQGSGDNGQLWYSVFDGSNWATDTQVQNLGMSGSPSAVLWADGISVFHQGSGDGSLWYDYFDGTNWYGDTLVPNLGMSGSPSTVVYNGLLYVFHQGPNNDGQLWYSSNDGANWTADTSVQNVSMSGSPWAVLWAGGISVFHQGSENNGSLWYSYFDGTNWYPDTLVQNLAMSGSPSCVVF
jgi:mannan endo-1,4-beta-mannosidase